MMKDNKELVILAGKGSGGGGSGTDANAVHYTADSGKSDSDRAAARANIGADAEKLIVTVSYDDQTSEYSADKTFAEIEAAFSGGATVLVLFGDYSEDAASVYTLTGASDGASYRFSHVWVRAYLDSLDNRQSIIADTLSVDDTDYWEFASAEYQPTLYKTVSSTSGSFGFVSNSMTTFGEMSSLTILSYPASGSFAFEFDSGSTPTVTDFPATIKFPSNYSPFAASANTHYEINVRNGFAVVSEWPTA